MGDQEKARLYKKVVIWGKRERRSESFRVERQFSSLFNMSYISTGGPPPWLVRFFHRFPHINVTGNRVNSTFDWRNEVYLESLGILASLPALLLIFFLLMLLLYLLTRCCDRNAKRDRPLLCLKVLLTLLGMLCW